jgi:hypothetical protein
MITQKRQDRDLSIHLIKDENGNPKALFDLPAYVRYCERDDQVDQFFDSIAKCYDDEAEKLKRADWNAAYVCTVDYIDKVFPLAKSG